MGILFNMKDKFVKDWENVKPTSIQENPLEIIIKPDSLDTSNVIEGEGSGEYRPSVLHEFVGQEHIKTQLLDYIQGCKDFNEPFPHTFLSGSAGHGKSLLANIISNMLNKKFIKITGGEIKTEQFLIDKICECEGGVVFIDEANRLSKRIGFFMLPLIEMFEVQNKKMKPFTMIFATTHKGDIAKDLDALIQRCDLKLNFEHYNMNELIIILKQYHNKQYCQSDVPENIYIEIAKNCKQTPRIALKLLRHFIYTKDWNKVKTSNQIVRNGVTSSDIKILKYLQQFPNGLGKNTLANYLRVKPQTYEYEYEPYLVFQEYLIVENRRKITEKGKDFLHDLAVN